MSVVVPVELKNADAGILKFEHGSFLFAVDIPGYGFMSLSSLFAAPVFGRKDRFEKQAKIFLYTNGVLAPFLCLQTVIPALFYVAALQVITFPVAMVFVAMAVKRTERTMIS